MHSSNNRTNHDFQIRYFLVGACHTPDAAYALLCDLKENRSDALKIVTSANLKREAKQLRAEAIINAPFWKAVSKADKLEAQADLEEIKANEETYIRNVEAAKAELDFIQYCLDTIEPHRKYKDLPLPEAHEAAQRDEWKYELIDRAHNFLLTSGTIPHDHYSTMRMHPDFASEILPEIEKVTQQLMNGILPTTIARTLKKPGVELPKLALKYEPEENPKSISYAQR